MHPNDSPPSAKGTYLLIFTLPDAATLRIGKLGTFDFPSGIYAYVGSAFGSGGLRGRLKHHLAPVSKPHWHIDYFRGAATLDSISFLVSPSPLEHQWAAFLGALPTAAIPAPRFGASDCACPAHLFHFPRRPTRSTASRV